MHTKIEMSSGQDMVLGLYKDFTAWTFKIIPSLKIKVLGKMQ